MSDPDAYTIGWISALDLEYTAAQEFFDDEHEGPSLIDRNDDNNYSLGRIGKHNVAMAVLPTGETGVAAAALAAKSMWHTFRNIRFCLMVGIGGGVPSDRHDIRLGDVVVSAPTFHIDSGNHGGVVQYDYGNSIRLGRFQSAKYLNQPPKVLRTALNGLRARYKRKGHQIDETITNVLTKNRRLRKEYSRPVPDIDTLHPFDSLRCTTRSPKLLDRLPRTEDDDDPMIHYGLIASADTFMEDAHARDTLSKELDVLCFEMEAAGLMNDFPCLVIRGICDYCDKDWSREWRGYAAMAAAALAKDLLQEVVPHQVHGEKTICEAMSHMQESLDLVHQTSSETKAEVKLLRSNQNMDKIERWMSPPNYSANVNHARELRQEGTGTWLLKSDSFEEWILGSRRHLWLHGLPGCGKTVLSSAIFDHVEKLDDRLTLTFFFDFADNTKQTLKSMLCSLVFQLYKLRVHTAKEVDSLFKTHHDGRDHPGTKVLSDTLHAMIKIPDQKICIVLDAIDECTTRTALLNWMNQWFSMHDLDMIQLIATGRPEAEFQNCIPRWIGEANCVSLDKESINTDIHAYVSARLREGPEFKKWASFPSVKTQIRDEIGGKADGMFRWAACQLDHLESCLDREGIETALKSLPRDLNETYHRILENIPQERKTMAIRLLQFLVYSERPLTVAEAIDVVAVRINEGQRYFDVEDRMPNPPEIIRFCPNLLTIIPVVRHNGRIEEQIHLAHFSVKEYLLHLQVGFAFLEASIVIMHTCLAYLTSVNDTCTRRVKRQFPLARYAAQIWMEHAGPADESGDVAETIIKFLNDKPAFKLSTRLYNPERPWDPEPGDTNASSLYFACLKGLTNTTRGVLSRGLTVNAQGGEYGNALQAASYGGHREIVQLLMDNGADVNAQGGMFGNALQAASYGGHREIVQLLMKHGVNINFQFGNYGYSLQAASYRGHQEIVQLLMNNGADVRAQGGQYGNALQAASYGGHPEIVQLLMDNGADINARDGEYGNALQAASYGGHREIMQLLMDNGADVNAQGGQYGDALQAASDRGDQEIVQLLMDNCANVNAQGGQYGNALQAASYGGHPEIVQLLMDIGADVDAQGGQYGNALQAASYGGYREIVQLLMDNGADVNAQGGLFGNALHAAVRERHEDVVCLLLQNGCADPSITDERGWTALHVVCEVGDLKLAKILLNAGADAVASDHSGWTPCHVAAGLDRVELVALLLSHMAVNALQRDHSGGIPAFYTAVRNGLDVLDAMLTEDMDLGTAEDRYVTGDVTAAKRNSHTDFSKPLPLTTHQMNSVDIFGRSIIYWAEQSGDPELLATVTTHASQQGFQSDQRNQRGDA